MTLEFLQFFCWILVWYLQVIISGSHFKSRSSSSFLFWHSSLREIICLVVSGWKHACKAFERKQYTKETDYYKQDNSQCLVHFRATVPETQTGQNQMLKKDLTEAVTFSSQMDCSVILCSWDSTFPQELIQVEKVVLAIAQTPPWSSKRWSKAIPLSRKNLTRESRDFCEAAIALAADSAISSRVRRHFWLQPHLHLLLTRGVGLWEWKLILTYECFLEISNWVYNLGLERWQWRPGYF